jgi:hypothetical protein
VAAPRLSLSLTLAGYYYIAVINYAAPLRPLNKPI